MFFILTIIISVILIIAVDTLIFGFSTLLSFAIAVVVTTVSVIAVDGLFATIVRWIMPKKWFSIDKKNFIASKKESLFYEKIGIKKWKDLIIELGFFTNFRKNKIAEPNNNQYVERYIVEANYGIAVHLSCMLFGFLVVLIYPSLYLSVGIPVCLVNLVLNFMPVACLRYNLTKLHKIYRINEKRAKMNASKTNNN